MMLDIDYFGRLSYCVSDVFDINNVVLQSVQIAVITLLVGEIIY